MPCIAHPQFRQEVRRQSGKTNCAPKIKGNDQKSDKKRHNTLGHRKQQIKQQPFTFKTQKQDKGQYGTAEKYSASEYLRSLLESVPVVRPGATEYRDTVKSTDIFAIEGGFTEQNPFLPFRFSGRFPYGVCHTRFKDPFTEERQMSKGKYQPQEHEI